MQKGSSSLWATVASLPLLAAVELAPCFPRCRTPPFPVATGRPLWPWQAPCRTPSRRCRTLSLAALLRIRMPRGRPRSPSLLLPSFPPPGNPNPNPPEPCRRRHLAAPIAGHRGCPGANVLRHRLRLELLYLLLHPCVLGGRRSRESSPSFPPRVAADRAPWRRRPASSGLAVHTFTLLVSSRSERASSRSPSPSPC